MIKLVVALGNPGLKYEFTRHNIAWLLFDEFFNSKSPIWKKKFKGEYCELNIDGEKRYFLKPQTFMNLSGESVQPLCQFFKIKAEEILVIHDELDLPFGQITFKNGGGLAGHNGLKSINQSMGTNTFLRLRVGIDRPVHGSVSSWVLGSFNKDEEISLGKILIESSKALEKSLKDGFQKASNQFSKKNFL